MRILSFVLVLLFPLAVVAEVVIENVKFNSQAVPVKLLVYAQKQSAPTIIISHGSSCIPPRKLQWAYRLESWGYNAVVIDHCVNRGIKPHTAQDLPRNLQVEDRVKDYAAIADWVRQQSFHKGKVGLIGFSRGGEGVLGFLNEAYYAGKANLPIGYAKAVDAAVAYYPSCLIGDRELREPPIPLLVNIGELDALTPPINCAFYKEGSAGKIANLMVETYPGSHHSFDLNLPDRWATTPRGQVLVVSYNAKQAERSFENTKAFFDKNLK
jgi:dienelactone hydrolase